MRPVPIPDEAVDLLGGHRRVVIGEPGDPTRDDVRPCEYAVGASELYPGRPTFTALIVLDDEDRAAFAAGAALVLTLDGAEVPWNVGWVRGLDLPGAPEAAPGGG